MREQWDIRSAVPAGEQGTALLLCVTRGGVPAAPEGWLFRHTGSGFEERGDTPQTGRIRGSGEVKTAGRYRTYSLFMSNNESDRIVISDHLYLTPETVDIWERLSEEEKQHHIEEAVYFSEEYNEGKPLSFADVQGAELRGA